MQGNKLAAGGFKVDFGLHHTRFVSETAERYQEGLDYMKTLQDSAIKIPTGIDIPPEHLDVKWYAAYTRSRHEKRVLEQLQVKSIECFLPLFNVMSHWKDRDTRVQLPLFPGYVFVRIDLRNRMGVLQAPGVVRLVGQDNKPESLPEMEIKALRTAMTQKIPLDPHPYLQTGESVIITNGPFEGLEGVLLRKNRLRVVLSLAQIHSSFVLDVDALDIQPIRPWFANGPRWQLQGRQISNIASSNRGVVTGR